MVDLIDLKAKSSVRARELVDWNVMVLAIVGLILVLGTYLMHLGSGEANIGGVPWTLIAGGFGGFAVLMFLLAARHAIMLLVK